jgi:NAD(P)-dependent dehydrogenase (short-subunit alcohol dehydrogenase family)
MKLVNKNALITGATGGLGKEIAIALALKDCRVFITGRNKNELESLSKSIGSNCLGYLACDLEIESEIELLVTAATRAAKFKSGVIDILINCAGVFPVANVSDTTFEDFDSCFNINVRAPFFLSKLLYSEMKSSSWGRIVNVGSSSAYGGFSGTSVYCASKHALLGISRSMYNEFKEDGVRVFSVSPGSIQTPMGKKVKNQDYSTFMNPSEIASFICNLISYDDNMIAEEVRLNRVIIR